MKPVLYLLLLLGVPFAAWADVQIKYKDMAGATNTMRSDGQKVRINNRQTAGYVLVDSEIDTFYMIDTKRKEIVKFSADEIGGAPAGKKLNVSLKARGGSDKIAGYRTGRFDLISDGLACGSLNGSSELIENPELKNMLEAMQGMHKMSRMSMAGLGALSECQQASAQMGDLVDTTGFVMRYVDDQGETVFEVTSVKTDKKVEEGYYDLPSGMKVIDMDKHLKQLAKQSEKMEQEMPDLENVMKQIQEDGKLDDETQDQLKEMLKQLQSE
jgi:hypothetical protein